MSASVPNSSTGRADIIVTGKKPIGICPRANSSHSRHRSTEPPPVPPYSSGIAAPSQPSVGDLRVDLRVMGLAPVFGERVALFARAALALGEVADRLDERALLVGQVQSCSLLLLRRGRGAETTFPRRARRTAGIIGHMAQSTVFRPGGVSYLRIPAPDPQRTATFYAAVFGWTVDNDRENPSFADGSGHVIGHFMR